MAIIINSNPPSGSSVHDNMWHVATSDNSGLTDMKYVFDVYIGGVQKIRVKQYPEPDNGKAYFDAGPTVRNSMTYAWFEPVDTAYAAQPDMNGQIGIVYSLRVGEDVSGVTTSNMASGEISGYNWCPPMFKRRVTGLSDKLNKWLTNRPLLAKTKEGERLYAGFYTNTALTLRCETFDGSNNSITSVSGSSTPVPNGFVQMNIGTTALTALLGISFSGVKYYDVWFNSFEKMRVYLTCNPKYTPTLIHFLNRWGMYDTQRFDLVSKLTMDVERKGFEQRDYKLNGNSVDYYSSSNRYYEGKLNYSNKAAWTYKLTADAMSDADYEWMADLMGSPQILLEHDGYCYPVTIEQTNYEYSTYVNNRLKPLEIEFKLNTNRMTQLR